MKIFKPLKQIKKVRQRLSVGLFALGGCTSVCYSPLVWPAVLIKEPVQACILVTDEKLTDEVRTRYADCLAWVNQTDNVCYGSYQPLISSPVTQDDEIRLEADNASFYTAGRSTISGNVSVQQNERIVNAQTAYVYYDPKLKQITTIELLGNVEFIEPDHLMVARKVTINAQDKSGTAEDVLYRFTTARRGAVLPAWGRAALVERFTNKDYLLNHATYSTCAPQDKAWRLEAEKLTIEDATSTGVARHAKLYIGKVPVLYSPYLTFPTSKKRKSGFLLPTIGSSNIGGFDFSLPYYWNMAPNYDATIIPHLYTRRGLMMGGQFRYLTKNSNGIFNGRFLPKDRALHRFILDNIDSYPELSKVSTNRWSFSTINTTQILQDLDLHINFQAVSDDYFLQDFSSNLAVLTERQLLREGRLTYTTDHWLLRGMLQDYQTLQPVNATPISEVYQRLPQLLAQGYYDDLLFNGNFTILGQYDNFSWPNHLIIKPAGPRYYLNPVLNFPQLKPWGFLTPGIELVQNYYDLNKSAFVSDPTAEPFAVLSSYNYSLNNNDVYNHTYSKGRQYFSNTIPRYSVDGGLYFDRNLNLWGKEFTQTLEPRLFYLYVPYKNQMLIPVFDSAYPIFTVDQLFRNNRFSGFDRIGDTNQLSYAVTSRWLSEETGDEKALFALGQIRYFKDRRVQLCQSNTGYCLDSPLTFGYLSPTSGSSPIASRAAYHFNPFWTVTADYVWNPATHKTNNSNLNFHYQPAKNQLINLGYTYLTNGDITQVAYTNAIKDSLHQATISYAWPFSERWSSLGAYSYNISKQYEMMSFLGLQYDSCCWAVRLIGGRAFQSLNSLARPQYNNNIYFQVLLKGLGSVGNSDPISTIRTFIPGYVDNFHI